MFTVKNACPCPLRLFVYVRVFHTLYAQPFDLGICSINLNFYVDLGDEVTTNAVGKERA